MKGLIFHKTVENVFKVAVVSLRNSTEIQKPKNIKIYFFIKIRRGA
jgi:hypothetical protein